MYMSVRCGGAISLLSNLLHPKIKRNSLSGVRRYFPGIIYDQQKQFKEIDARCLGESLLQIMDVCQIRRQVCFPVPVIFIPGLPTDASTFGVWVNLVPLEVTTGFEWAFHVWNCKCRTKWIVSLRNSDQLGGRRGTADFLTTLFES